MKNESMIETAAKILEAEGHGLAFSELWKKIVAELEISEEEIPNRIGHFYTDLSLDGNFVALTDNVWDLRKRHTYDKVHSDVNDVYSDVNESDMDEVDLAEEKDYNKSVEGLVGGDAASEEEEENDDSSNDNEAAELVGMGKNPSNDY